MTDTGSIPLPRRLLRRVQHSGEFTMVCVYFIGGLAALANAPNTVRDNLGPGFHQIWVALLLFGPALVAAGTFLHDQWVGAWFRVAGGVAIAAALGAFAASLGTAFGFTFTGILVMGLNVATLVAVVRDARLLRK